MRKSLIKHAAVSCPLRRNLLVRSATIIAGSILCSGPGRANIKPGKRKPDTLHHTLAQADPTSLQAILDNFADAARSQHRIKATVVSLGGQTVFGEAFRGPSIDHAVNIKSVSKSVVATLLGVARHRSVISSLEQTLEELAPELVPQGASARVANLTLDDLVTMRTGLERTSGRAYGIWVNSSNWIHHVLSRQFVDEPGGRMLYSTGDTHVLGAVLSQLTGRSLHQLANEWLGKPLGIDFPAWTRDPQGYYMGGNEMSLSPLHLVRLGELYLANGVVDNRRVFDSRWVQDAFTARTRSVYSGDGYGYGWFLRELAGVPAAYARGYGGQVLHVLPGMSLVVAITSDPTLRARSNGYMAALHNLVAEKLVAPLNNTQ